MNDPPTAGIWTKYGGENPSDGGSSMDGEGGWAPTITARSLRQAAHAMFLCSITIGHTRHDLADFNVSSCTSPSRAGRGAQLAVQLAAYQDWR